MIWFMTFLVILVQAILVSVIALVLNELFPTAVVPFITGYVITWILITIHDNLSLLYHLRHNREEILEEMDKHTKGDNK